MLKFSPLNGSFKSHETFYQSECFISTMIKNLFLALARFW